MPFAARQGDSFEYLADQKVSLGGGQAAADDQIVDPEAEHRRRIVWPFGLNRDGFGHSRFLSQGCPHRIEAISEF